MVRQPGAKGGGFVMPPEETLRELAAWWRGVAKDERQTALVMQHHSRGHASRAAEREKVWDCCAQQLELVLAGKPFNPDL